MKAGREYACGALLTAIPMLLNELNEANAPCEATSALKREREIANFQYRIDEIFK